MPSDAASAPDSVKILVAGGFGAGKTTFVGSVSEIDPISTEAQLTRPSEATDDLAGVEHKATTTVALDFGRRTFDDLVLYLFGTPGQERFWFLWNDLVRGAIGAVVLADTRRMADCFAAVDFFESRGVPFIVGINRFHGSHPYPPDAIRASLDLRPETPVVELDARDPDTSRDALIALINYRLGVATPQI